MVKALENCRRHRPSLWARHCIRVSPASRRYRARRASFPGWSEV